MYDLLNYIYQSSKTLIKDDMQVELWTMRTNKNKVQDREKQNSIYNLLVSIA